MARKETITKTDILNAAFEMTMEEGFDRVTARTLAAKAGCSTQPIFRVYRNMEELGVELFGRVVAYFDEYYGKFPKKVIRLLSTSDLLILNLRRIIPNCSSCYLIRKTSTEKVFMIF